MYHCGNQEHGAAHRGGEDATYQEIARQTGASSATISRVNRALLYGANGYTAVLDAMENAAEKEKKD